MGLKSEGRRMPDFFGIRDKRLSEKFGGSPLGEDDKRMMSLQKFVHLGREILYKRKGIQSGPGTDLRAIVTIF